MSAPLFRNAPPRPFPGLLQRRSCLLPTWRGWLALLIAAGLCGLLLVRGIHGFLAVQDSIPGGILVAEGWTDDYALAAALEEYRRERYDGFFVTGIPMEKGAALSEYGTYAELSAAILLRLGADPRTLHAVPAPAVRQDRTYATAVALREWLRAHRFDVRKVNVVSVGPHARRTRLIYEHAFGTGTRVGIIAVPDRDFDAARWWRSSQGFRVVTGEAIAYLYARFLFHPSG